MNRPRPILAGIALGTALVALPVLAAQEADADAAPVPPPTPPTEVPTPSPDPRAGRNFDQFRLVLERNIFDSDRRKPLPPGRTPPPEPTRPPRQETISLNGAICYDSKAFAFLGSSESDYRGIFSAGDEIAGLRLVAITSRGITLEGPAGRLEVPVGQGLARTGDQPWTVSAVTSAPPAPSNTSGASSRPERTETAESTESTGETSGGMSDIMRRLMERRRAQTGQ